MLARLKPLSPAAARALAEHMDRPADDVTRAAPLTFRSDDPPASVRTSLAALPIDPATPIVMSWGPAAALETEWEIFVAHWDDFCYPASDDVVIRPIDGRWTLRYHRYEVFQLSHDGPVATDPSPGADRA